MPDESVTNRSVLASQVVLNCSALPCLLHLLSSAKESIRKEACWTISNITAGNRGQIQVMQARRRLIGLFLRVIGPRVLLSGVPPLILSHSAPQTVIDANIFPVLIDILQKAEFRTRKEAAWAITNATSGGTPEQIRSDPSRAVRHVLPRKGLADSSPTWSLLGWMNL